MTYDVNLLEHDCGMIYAQFKNEEGGTVDYHYLKFDNNENDKYVWIKDENGIWLHVDETKIEFPHDSINIETSRNIWIQLSRLGWRMATDDVKWLTKVLVTKEKWKGNNLNELLSFKI